MAHLRLTAPLRQVGLRILDGVQNGHVVREQVREGDVVIVQREFPKRFDDYQEVVRITRQEGKPLIFELDDLLFFLPKDHPDRLEHSFASALSPMLQALLEADLVAVSTPALCHVLTNYNTNVVVLPNYLDDSLWSLRPPILKDSSQETLTIGYMGTYSHKPDLEYVAPVLLHLAERYPQKVRFHFWGPQPPAELSALPQVEWSPFFSHSYEEFAAYFQTQSIDIAIAPLIDNLFNRCKSPLKFFEYSALGATGVYSRLDPYENVVEHGRNGLLASTLDEWEECLILLIEDDERRLRLAQQAQTTVAEGWLLSRIAPRWLETFHNALETKGKTRRNDFALSMLRSINIQQFEALQASATHVAKQNQKIQELAAQMEEQRQTIQQVEAKNLELKEENLKLEEEILSYVLSRSWQMTRPLRMVGKKLKASRGVNAKGTH